jgi:hypothetical protein
VRRRGNFPTPTGFPVFEAGEQSTSENGADWWGPYWPYANGMYYTPDPMWTETSLGAFSDYASVGKAVAYEGSYSCLLVYGEDLGEGRTSWTADNGRFCSLPIWEPSRCIPRYKTGKIVLDKDSLYPEGSPARTEANVLVLLRQEQRAYIVCNTTGPWQVAKIPPRVPSAVEVYVPEGAIWPDCCAFPRPDWSQEERGLSSDEYPQSEQD